MSNDDLSPPTTKKMGIRAFWEMLFNQVGGGCFFIIWKGKGGTSGGSPLSIALIVSDYLVYYS